MDYAKRPKPLENHVWACEVCGYTYTQAEVNRLEWYNGHRCSQPVEEGLLCGGIVIYKKVES